VDFVRGSAMSKRGKSIMVLPSTTEDGNIAHRPLPFAWQRCGRNAGRYPLRGDGIRHSLCARQIHPGRAMMLINIAHPDFRDELLEAARRQGYIYRDQTLPVVLYPKEYEVNWVDK